MSKKTLIPEDYNDSRADPFLDGERELLAQRWNLRPSSALPVKSFYFRAIVGEERPTPPIKVIIDLNLERTFEGVVAYIVRALRIANPNLPPTPPTKMFAFYGYDINDKPIHRLIYQLENFIQIENDSTIMVVFDG